MPPARQSDLASRPTYLPPLSPSAPSHPHHAAGVPALQSFPVKVSTEVLNAIIEGQQEATITFHDNEQGTIHLPNHPDVGFSTRSIYANNAETARAALYSRRRNNLRLVGPILHEMDIYPRMPNEVSAATKKRALNTRQTPSKKPRVRKNPEKRPRAPLSRPTPAIPQSVQPPNINTSATAVRPPRSSPPNGNSLRSSSLSPPTENGRQPVPKRASALGRNSIGALGSRRMSPSKTSLPKAGGRQTPTKSRLSPITTSRVMSPKKGGALSPSRARMNPRPKMSDADEIRRHVMHSLALGDMQKGAIRRRHEALNMDSTVLNDVLDGVADAKNGTYKLKKSMWREVYDGYSEYSEMEKKRMKENRVEVCGVVDGRLNAEGMNNDMLQEEMNSVVSEMGKASVGVKNDEEENKIRKRYETIHSVYIEVINRMEMVSSMFRRLAAKLKACGDGGKEEITCAICLAHSKHSKQYESFVRVLPTVHGYLKQIRQAIEKYERSEI